MRAWLPGQEPAGDSAARHFERGRSGSMVVTFRCRPSRKTLRLSGCRREGRELCDALCLRTSARFSDRCLDRTRFEGEIFPKKKKSDPATVTRVLRIVFRGIRRVCAAVPGLSSPAGFASITTTQRFLPPSPPLTRRTASPHRRTKRARLASGGQERKTTR